MKDTVDLSQGWMNEESLRARDVELYVDIIARRSGERGLAATTLGGSRTFFSTRVTTLSLTATSKKEGDPFGLRYNNM